MSTATAAKEKRPLEDKEQIVLPSPLPPPARRSVSTGPLLPSPQSIGAVDQPKSISATFLTDEESEDHRRTTSSTDDHVPDLRVKKFPSRPSSLLGDRSVSTSIRLRRQGFQPTTKMDFAVRSIRRGSDDWHQLLRPFVADLAFRSLEYRRYHSGVSFRPYTCQASVLFCDLSNYSGITSVIAHRGAHALSSIVNAYFARLLHIVNRYVLVGNEAFSLKNLTDTEEMW